MKKTILAMAVMGMSMAASAAVADSSNNTATVEGDTLGGSPNNAITINQTQNSNNNSVLVTVDGATDNDVLIDQENSVGSSITVTLPGVDNDIDILQGNQENSTVTLTATGEGNTIDIGQISDSYPGSSNSILATVSSTNSTVTLVQSGLNDNSSMTVDVLNGDGNTVTATQSVDDISVLTLMVDGGSNLIDVTQSSPAGGGDQNTATLSVTGDSNDLDFVQSGYGHGMTVTVVGNSNTGLMSQSGDLGQILTVGVTGNGNATNTTQDSDMSSTSNIDILGSMNDVIVLQSGFGGHMADVDLINDSNIVSITQNDSVNTATVDLNADALSAGSAGNTVTINQGTAPL